MYNLQRAGGKIEDWKVVYKKKMTNANFNYLTHPTPESTPRLKLSFELN